MGKNLKIKSVNEYEVSIEIKKCNCKRKCSCISVKGKAKYMAIQTNIGVFLHSYN